MEKEPVKKIKKKQVQPKTHVGKSKEVVAARRKKIVKAVLEGKTQQEAGVEAGLNPNSAYSQVHQILQKPLVKKTFLEYLNEAIPDDFHSNVYRDGMNATKVLAPELEVPDHPTRIRAADSVSKLKGLVVDRQQHGLDERAVELILAALPAEVAVMLRAQLFEGR